MLFCVECFWETGLLSKLEFALVLAQLNLLAWFNTVILGKKQPF